MFTENTVFVLGAGASWHYGYPTGEELVKEVIKKSEQLSHMWRKYPIWGNATISDCVPEWILQKLNSQRANEGCGDAEWQKINLNLQEFTQLLKLNNYLVIDYFLGHHPTYADIGKWLISLVIMESTCKNISQGLLPRAIEGKDWFQLIQAKITSGCVPGDVKKTIKNNQVRFITFNYDWSVERCLARLANIELLGEDAKEWMEEDGRFIHIYGHIPYHVQKEAVEYILKYKDFKYFESKSFFDLAWTASKNIRTIPETKSDNSDLLQKAKGIIKQANRVYILGYGFDEENNENLDLKNLLCYKENKHVFFTNYADHKRINKRAARVFCLGGEDAFVGQMLPHIKGRIEIAGLLSPEAGKPYYEKSIKNVYDALAYDFDL